MTGKKKQARDQIPAFSFTKFNEYRKLLCRIEQLKASHPNVDESPNSWKRDMDLYELSRCSLEKTLKRLENEKAAFIVVQRQYGRFPIREEE